MSETKTNYDAILGQFSLNLNSVQGAVVNLQQEFKELLKYTGNIDRGAAAKLSELNAKIDALSTVCLKKEEPQVAAPAS